MKRVIPSLVLLAAGAFGGLRSDIEFGRAGDLSLTLDAYVPEGSGPFPAVIVVHGGGWRNGDKQTYVKPLFDPLTQAGFAWFTINYRLAPKYHFPAPVDDVITAIRWVQSHAAEYKVDVNRIAITGESAGGHLVSFVGARDGARLKLRAVVPFYAPNDLEAMITGPDKTKGADPAIRALLDFTEPDAAAVRRMKEASPVTYVKKGMPPFLLIHGAGDATVPFHQATLMCDKMKQAGSSCEIFAVEGGPHGVINWEKNPAMQAYKSKMVEWLKQKLH
ncbi:MAG TPA: alpha/beta hydrolase [Bryobacteraceae bacterium]|nr:alpha/beta hydrolase [Bryobacteraceae bacterium]